jgi:hypothetical protein
MNEVTMADRTDGGAALPCGWALETRPRSFPPGQWWGARHSSGYSVGEVDAGRYLVADPNEQGVMSEAGDYLGFTTAEGAMEHVDALLTARKEGGG